MFRAILCPSSGSQDCDLQYVVYCPQIVVRRRSGVRRHGLCVRCEGCCSTGFVKSRYILHTEHTVRAPALRTSDRQQSEDSIPRTVNHSLALLMMGKELPETCSANLKINKLLLLHLVGHLLCLLKRLYFSAQYIHVLRNI